jgi:hypothetical protein
MNWDQQGDKEKNKQTLKPNKQLFYERLWRGSAGLFRIAIHPPNDPDEALEDRIEMIEYLRGRSLMDL